MGLLPGVAHPPRRSNLYLLKTSSAGLVSQSDQRGGPGYQMRPGPAYTIGSKPEARAP